MQPAAIIEGMMPVATANLRGIENKKNMAMGTYILSIRFNIQITVLFRKMVKPYCVSLMKMALPGI